MMDNQNSLVDRYDQNIISLIEDLNKNNAEIDPDIAEMFGDYKIDTPSIHQSGMSIIHRPNGGFN